VELFKPCHNQSLLSLYDDLLYQIPADLAMKNTLRNTGRCLFF